MSPRKMSGIVLRLGQYHIHLWKSGIEFGNRMGGRVYFFPWHPQYKVRK